MCDGHIEPNKVPFRPKIGTEVFAFSVSVLPASITAAVATTTTCQTRSMAGSQVACIFTQKAKNLYLQALQREIGRHTSRTRNWSATWFQLWNPALQRLSWLVVQVRVLRFIPFICVLNATLVRTGHRRLLLTHVCVLCVRRPVAATTNPSRQEHGAASTRRLQRNGTRDVVYWKRFWKSRRAVRWYRVRDRVGE